MLKAAWAPPSSLPLLDAMVPGSAGSGAETAGRQARRGKARAWCASRTFTGAAGCNDLGRVGRTSGRRPRTGKNFDLSPSSLNADRSSPSGSTLTIVSDTDCRMADAFSAFEEIGGGPLPDGRRLPDAGASEADPRVRTSSSGRRSIRSMPSASVHLTRRSPSMQLSRSRTWTRPVAARTATPASTRTRSAGRLRHGAPPDDPRPAGRLRAALRRRRYGRSSALSVSATDRSILDWVMGELSGLRRNLGAGRPGAPRPLHAEHPRAGAAHLSASRQQNTERRGA